ncbi:MAG: DUF4446 family protein [Clostridia bacterium]|jgi:hypothetical protein|nr:DUF4446 family protein [Clostridia bacterium]
MEFIMNYSFEIIIGLLVINLFSFIRLIVLQKKYTNYMTKSTAKNVEGLINEYLEQVESSVNKLKNIDNRVENLEAEILTCVKKVGIVRYNAFENMGSNLCFALALLDEHNDGVVINGIHGRDGCMTYAKPIKDSKSEYNLSVEEVEAIDKAKKF